MRIGIGIANAIAVLDGEVEEVGQRRERRGENSKSL